MKIEFEKYYLEYLKDKRQQFRLEKNVFHPSGMGTECIRKLWYGQQFHAEIDEKTMKIFEGGQTLHNWFVEFLKWCDEHKKGIMLIESEREIVIPLDVNGDELWVTGRIDNFIATSEGRAVVEVKSINSLKYVRESPKEHHVVQANLYMKGSRSKYALIVYIEKSSFKIKTFLVPFDEKLYLKTLAKIKEVWSYLKVNKTPPRISETFDHWECRYCHFSGRCGGKFEAGEKYLNAEE